MRSFWRLRWRAGPLPSLLSFFPAVTAPVFPVLVIPVAVSISVPVSIAFPIPLSIPIFISISLSIAVFVVPVMVTVSAGVSEVPAWAVSLSFSVPAVGARVTSVSFSAFGFRSVCVFFRGFLFFFNILKPFYASTI